MWRPSFSIRSTYLPRLGLAGLGLGLAVVALGCESSDARLDDEGAEGGIQDVPDPIDPPAADPGEYLKGIDAEFTAAATEFDVPVDVLKAVGYVESQWQMVMGEVEFDGLDPAFGTMALRGKNLTRGASLLGVEADALKSTRLLNIRAAAAVLREKADLAKIDRKDLGAWAPAVAELSGIEDKSAAAVSYVHQNVYALIRNGLVVTDLDGEVISEIKPRIDVIPNYPGADGMPVLAANPDYKGATWRSTPNFSKRPAGAAGKPQIVIIHTCEGAYSGCWGWLAQAKSGVSAHYVVKEDGAEITQLVKEADKAWHIAAKYKSSLNGGKFAELEGSTGNNFTVGIEHAGYGKQASWNSNLIAQSASLVCDITRRNKIPRDKFHIVGHGQLQPYNRSDPGPNWPWATYFEKIKAACDDAPPPVEPPPVPPPNDPQPNDSMDPEQTTGDPPDGTTGDPPDETTGAPPDEPPVNPPPADPAEIIVDSFNANNALNADFFAPASWTSTASTPGYYGSNYLYASTTTKDDGAEFWFYLNSPATLDVDVWFTAGANRSDQTPIVAFDAGGKELGFLGVNMQAGGKAWVPAGTYNFTAGWNMVMVSRWAPANHVVIADAVRLSSN
jgi:N-acetyl-anhydromuramyl-L-alanine amidase AmpD